jgi:hypothetical protein
VLKSSDGPVGLAPSSLARGGWAPSGCE